MKLSPSYYVSCIRKRFKPAFAETLTLIVVGSSFGWFLAPRLVSTIVEQPAIDAASNPSENLRQSQSNTNETLLPSLLAALAKVSESASNPVEQSLRVGAILSELAKQFGTSGFKRGIEILPQEYFADAWISADILRPSLETLELDWNEFNVELSEFLSGRRGALLVETYIVSASQERADSIKIEDLTELGLNPEPGEPSDYYSSALKALSEAVSHQRLEELALHASAGTGNSNFLRDILGVAWKRLGTDAVAKVIATNGNDRRQNARVAERLTEGALAFAAAGEIPSTLRRLEKLFGTIPDRGLRRAFYERPSVALEILGSSDDSISDDAKLQATFYSLVNYPDESIDALGLLVNHSPTTPIPPATYDKILSALRNNSRAAAGVLRKGMTEIASAHRLPDDLLEQSLATVVARSGFDSAIDILGANSVPQADGRESPFTSIRTLLGDVQSRYDFSGESLDTFKSLTPTLQAMILEKAAKTATREQLLQLATEAPSQIERAVYDAYEAGRDGVWHSLVALNSSLATTSSQQQSLINKIAETTVSRYASPSDGLEFIRGLPSIQQEDATHALASTWARTDPVGLSAWLSREPPGPVRTAGIAALLPAIENDPEMVILWGELATGVAE